MEHATALVDHDATTRPTTTRFEVKARNAKAGRLADVLIMHGATAAQAKALPVETRRTVAALAGGRVPSATTWELVVALVACVERNRDGVSLAERLEDHLAEEQLFARL